MHFRFVELRAGGTGISSVEFEMNRYGAFGNRGGTCACLFSSSVYALRIRGMVCGRSGSQEGDGRNRVGAPDAISLSHKGILDKQDIES